MAAKNAKGPIESVEKVKSAEKNNDLLPTQDPSPKT
jgi:hypothetical protein